MLHRQHHPSGNQQMQTMMGYFFNLPNKYVCVWLCVCVCVVCVCVCGGGGGGGGGVCVGSGRVCVGGCVQEGIGWLKWWKNEG